MDGLEELHKEQDTFIKNTLQEDKLVNQPIFESFNAYMEQSNIKVKKYSYKQQKIIIFLILLLLVSVGLNVYLGIVKQTPVTITNISEPAHNIEDKDPETIENDKEENLTNIVIEDTTIVDSTENTVENIVEVNTESNETTNTIIEEQEKIEPEEPVNTTLTPAIFTDIDTKEVESFVNQIAIGINKLKFNDTTNLESNTILLYIAQQYFNAKSSNSNSLSVDASYSSTTDNIHKFLSELTITDYSNIDYLKSYTNYIGYASRSKSYIYGNDYSVIGKEKYKCKDVTITNKEDNIYTAEANVTRTYEGEESTYKITFTFKVNNNYKYQKYKLLSLKSKITSSSVDNAIHLVGN